MRRGYNYSPSPPRSYRRRVRSPSPRDHYGGRDRDLPTSLLVRNLRRDCRPEDLRHPFGQFGRLKDIYLPRDYYTGEPRGFGFVQYYDPEDASDAKHYMDGQLVLGRTITVVFAEENRKKPQEMRAKDRVRFAVSSQFVYLATELQRHRFSVHYLLHIAEVVLTIGGILALGPRVILGADLLPAAEATRGLPHLRMQSTDSERGPTPAHLLTADQEVGAPMRSDSADPQGERGLFRLADEVVLWSRATVNLLTVIYLLCPLSHMICGISRASCRVMPEYAIFGYVLYLEGYGPY